MTFWLIDLVLLGALAFTAWRTGTMVRQLRMLRNENSSFRRMLAEADASIDRAAHAVVSFRGEGMETMRALEEKTRAARIEIDRLDHAMRSAELRFALAEHDARRAKAA